MIGLLHVSQQAATIHQQIIIKRLILVLFNLHNHLKYQLKSKIYKIIVIIRAKHLNFSKNIKVYQQKSNKFRIANYIFITNRLQTNKINHIYNFQSQAFHFHLYFKAKKYLLNVKPNQMINLIKQLLLQQQIAIYLQDILLNTLPINQLKTFSLLIIHKAKQYGHSQMSTQKEIC
ncbi:hypothetical protein TTHERM_000585028 (macronuclear) [Tetrahymena thermophila SB210]|uniref:Uncharacterized protein n=1 Tax=Tetrahymena thermophila (strain SB210) TaxID=312017 RepID=W7XH75_TETTS|nr:hypothetical protein TTHERM_000585028 [Tetrahymena thermophila SB210]EWS72374.1 hypothetical protein TTHERM_000585028 [Tetrahymena thermophila SB210]|eukprot:XP_012655096.1 hypothetical protein TTHERM_000585028 [Tetrahymena thermophila SB210]